MPPSVHSISKTLSANDTGETGGHQAGILVPKDPRVLGFFPRLNRSILNPRCHLYFETIAGERWELAFIYYNNRLFGGTRNEYRLTRLTKYTAKYGLKTGDVIFFEHSPDDRYLIRHEKKGRAAQKPGILVLGNSWRVIDI